MDIPRLPSRYTLLGSLGQGGEGRVFRVEDRLRGGELALKIAPPDSSSWLRREFETLRQIQHESLIRVFDWGYTENAEVFYTMELVVGGDWGERMGVPQPPEEVARILLSVLRGLAHLHCHGEFHRDLKPGNVLLGKDGCIKLADIGMSAGTQRTMLSGTPGYSAPELWQGAQADIRSDIYSVGVMAYEALTGRHPFAGRTIRDVVSGQLEGWVPSLGAHGVTLSADLERSVMRALERDPNLRPATADELMELLGKGDRIGTILGGRFVARADELKDICSLLNSPDPLTPTLVWIGGESGVGKSAFIDEIANRATSLGYSIVQVVETSDVGAFRSPTAPTFAESEQVWSLTQERPTLFVADVTDDDLGATARAMGALARHLHVIAREQGKGPQVLILCETHGQVSAADEFQKALELSPFGENETGAFLDGLLGSVDFQPEVIGWLASMAGGLPGRLLSVVGELIERNVVRRTAGRWQFKEDQDLPSIEGSLKRGKWDQSWGRLNQAEKTVIALLAIMPRGLNGDALEQAVHCADTQIDGLLAKGWIRRLGGRLQLASGEARRVALGSSAGISAAAEVALIEIKPDSMSREDIALLLLRNCISREAVKEGLWAASAARDRGDLRTTVECAKACLKISEALDDRTGTEEAEFLLAQALNLLGLNEQAVEHLTRNSRTPSAAREQLLGVIWRSQGRLDEAREHLESAISLAEQNRDDVVFLRSHAELAEVGWRHGNERARDTAIQRVRAALATEAASRGTVNDRAALIYQLGSALVFAGRRDEAKAVLVEGLALAPDDYWTMRLMTALSAAEYYLGEFDNALRRMDDAWRHAERGGFDLYKSRMFLNRATIQYGLGRFREAVEVHRLSAVWARRNGQEFEYLAARSNEAVNLMLLGEYESALSHAREGEELAAKLGNGFQFIKNLETQALCEILIGDYRRAEEFAETMLAKCEQFGYSDLTPRVPLLKGMLAGIGQHWSEAREQLLEAEAMLLKSRDWEDLPSVQIELQLVRAQKDPESAADALAGIVREVTRKGAVSVQLRGAFVLGEILLAGHVDDTQYRDILLTALGRSGEAGATEDEWRLNYVLGELSLHHRDRRAATSRFGQAMRGFRSIAERLSAEHRTHYFRTPHATRLLTRVSHS